VELLCVAQTIEGNDDVIAKSGEDPNTTSTSTSTSNNKKYDINKMINYSCRHTLVALYALMSSILIVSSFLPETKCIKRSVGRGASSNKLFSIYNGGASVPLPEEAELINENSNSSTLIEQDQQSAVIDAKPAKTMVGPKATPPGILRRTFPLFPWHQLPNWLTALRCMALPLFGVAFYQPGRHVATSVIFSVASLTDFLDGYLARRWDVSSAFGAFLDPVVSFLKKKMNHHRYV
jgi:CDP-alcohol phosphatidyltransferase